MNLSKIVDATPAPRRTQFSSCDRCRKARLACDAVRIGLQPDKPDESRSCSRCTRRGQKCTFEWIKTVKRPTTRPRRNSQAVHVPVPTNQGQFSLSPPDSLPSGHGASASDTPVELVEKRSIECHWGQTSASPVSIPNPTHNPNSPVSIPNPSPADYKSCPLDEAIAMVGDWLDRIFESCFEHAYGLWLGRHCCPFVSEPDSDIILHPTRLFSELDACLAEDWEARNVGSGWPSSMSRQEKDYQTEQSLRRAIHSFAARWLHLVPLTLPPGVVQFDITRELWRRARTDMLKVINRVSYRSVLTLFLFGLTPIPVGISEEEELDGLTGQICVQTALQQVQRLRERQQNHQFNGTKVSLGTTDMFSSPAPRSNFSRIFLSAESRAYWGALIFDTSASLTLNYRSFLTSGLHGVASESSWRVLKMGLGSFYTRTEDWRTGVVEMTDNMALEAIAGAGAGNMYLWKMIAVLKESLREGHGEEKVAEAWTACMEALEMFKATFRPLLDLCEPRIRFMDQARKLHWFQLMLHHNLGLLILIDGVAAAERSDLLAQLTQVRLEAERELLDAINFGLDNSYTIHGPPRRSSVSGVSGGISGVQSSSNSFPTVLSASLVAINPYPHSLVAAIQLVDKAVSRDYMQGKVGLEAYRRLKTTLLRALEQSPQMSMSVEAARREMVKSLAQLDRIGIAGKSLSMSPEIARTHHHHRLAYPE
ncbi:hypothetical protein HRR83_008600 [Exophiala dermatitidis]|uniref:Zn(2)-C6 fungal-type domain-containing protein n=1 Tax=Exophiala dermatitidis TaxID=5970 RepID=A0AAN6EXX2_EXODE|nr:hypothetical protein HRR73_008415 [Exophiala dermatitidis]KAJ4588308.1 hypothetical protein HRR83_008600 [Exophiala dermatitidis]KAJ4604090.1 hypothetical protein HRR84_001168 [Exophiala dermatitidis]KAJ4630374.1 hypothetical protein HRR88_002558 [Exophiala dermatitidis]KAJ4635369.1 hypothetical protein HRR89_007668 [Exophiala dermatitidis]